MQMFQRTSQVGIPGHPRCSERFGERTLPTLPKRHSAGIRSHTATQEHMVESRDFEFCSGSAAESWSCPLILEIPVFTVDPSKEAGSPWTGRNEGFH